jgi:hypothetical protein
MKKSGLSRRKFLGAAGAAASLAIVPAKLRGAAGISAAIDIAKVSVVRVASTVAPIQFDPDKALGSSMDILPQDVVDKIYTPETVKQCLSAGWGPITYRQNTELSIGAWHWNPHGSWSDRANKRGYFTGSDQFQEPIRRSYGYPLPRRGTTRNGGAEHGYSRLTDGNPETFWKSNPYLSSKFTGEPDSSHPQWVVIDLGAVEPVTHIAIHWAVPFARTYEIHYWTGEHPMDKPAAGAWAGFPNSAQTNGSGGLVSIEVSRVPMPVRFLRIWMTESAGAPTEHVMDQRDVVGYAIHEIYVGALSDHGEFVDLVQHRPDQNQTATYCSSIDPWHAEADIEMRGVQTGFDLFFTSGITNNLPAMIPISLLYGTPDDAAAQLSYLKKRGYAISYVEMGEEPDGQNVLPEDYAALYIQFADALHTVDPKLKLGGPVFEGVNEDIKVWPDAKGRTSWLGRFIDYLKERNRLEDLSFVSFEHYPYPPCEIVWADLYREPELIGHILDVWRKDGVPHNVPLMNTESNVTYNNAEQMVDIFSALWLADSVGAFLTAGGAVYYHSPIQPEPLRPGCHGFGTYGNYVADENLNIKAFTAQYHASRLINLEWVQHRTGVHKLYPAACDLKDEAGHTLITAYAVTRPTGEWSLMLINKDQSNPHDVRIAFDHSRSKDQSFSGPISFTTFGSTQYMWKPDGPNGHPDPNNPPLAKTLPEGTDIVSLPQASVTVLRGKVV